MGFMPSIGLKTAHIHHIGAVTTALTVRKVEQILSRTNPEALCVYVV